MVRLYSKHDFSLYMNSLGLVSDSLHQVPSVPSRGSLSAEPKISPEHLWL